MANNSRIVSFLNSEDLSDCTNVKDGPRANLCRNCWCSHSSLKFRCKTIDPSYLEELEAAHA